MLVVRRVRGTGSRAEVDGTDSEHEDYREVAAEGIGQDGAEYETAEGVFWANSMRLCWCPCGQSGSADMPVHDRLPCTFAQSGPTVCTPKRSLGLFFPLTKQCQVSSTTICSIGQPPQTSQTILLQGELEAAVRWTREEATGVRSLRSAAPHPLAD